MRGVKTCYATVISCRSLSKQFLVKFLVIKFFVMDPEEQSSCREVCRRLVRRLRKKGKERKCVQQKFLVEVANAGTNVEEAKVTNFGSNSFGNKNHIFC